MTPNAKKRIPTAAEMMEFLNQLNDTSDGTTFSTRASNLLLEMFDDVARAKYGKAARSKAIRQYMLDVVQGKCELR